jgi:23S rRNA G2069 N7-methylase RlmK/C1962 C5-methylase RlmI
MWNQFGALSNIIASAALDDGTDATIIDHLSQGNDHPVSLNFPEGPYWEGIRLRDGVRVCYNGDQ